MKSSEEQPGGNPPDDFTRTGRYKVGLTLIVGGHLVLLVGLVVPFLGAGAGLVGALVLGGEVIALSSIVFLGKAGFLAIKSKIVGAVKASYTHPVGRVRHYVGIVLLLTNALTTWTVAVYAGSAFSAITPETPLPRVWGLDHHQQDTMLLWLFLIGEISFLIGIYVMGADWWGRFRRIFVWEKPEAEVGATASE